MGMFGWGYGFEKIIRHVDALIDFGKHLGKRPPRRLAANFRRLSETQQGHRSMTGYDMQ